MREKHVWIHEDELLFISLGISIFFAIFLLKVKKYREILTDVYWLQIYIYIF